MNPERSYNSIALFELRIEVHTKNIGAIKLKYTCINLKLNLITVHTLKVCFKIKVNKNRGKNGCGLHGNAT